MTGLEGYDLARTIPLMTLIAMGITLFLSVAVPIAAFQLCRKRFLAQWQFLFYGIMDFLIVEYLLCNGAVLILFQFRILESFAVNYKFFYILISTVLVSAIAECGRYFFIQIMSRQNLHLGNSFMFSVGTAGARSILLIASSAFQGMTIAMTINSTGLNNLVEAAGENALEMLQTIEPFYTTSPFSYLTTGIDILVSFAFHAALTLIVYIAFTKQLIKLLLPLAITLRILLELPSYMYSYHYLISNIYTAELIILIITGITVFLAFRLIKKYLPDELYQLINKKSTQKSFPKFNKTLPKS